MFCPRCQCEFRPGYTRCVSCDVELVEDLSAVEPEHIDAPEPEPARIQFAEICGYLDLEEARRVRDLLHHSRIACELAIRATPESPVEGPVVEEFWLRADASQGRQVQALLEGSPAVEQPQGSGFKCSKCDRPVREDESYCANCGTRFSE